eukprot:gene54268-45769_t
MARNKMAFFDESHQRPYWHNDKTGETVWTRPGGMGA